MEITECLESLGLTVTFKIDFIVWKLSDEEFEIINDIV